MPSRSDQELIEVPKSLDELLADSPQVEALPVENDERTEPAMESAVDHPHTQILSKPTTARLKLLNLKSQSPFLTLVKDELIIGRDTKVDLLVAHPSVSAKHARLVLRNGHYRIQDLMSTNGTRVNSELIRECELRCHDIVEFGDVRCEYLEGAAHPMAQSPQVIELMEEFEFKGVTRRPPLKQTLQRYRLPLVMASGLLLILTWSSLKQSPGRRQPAPEQLIKTAFSLSESSAAVPNETQRIIGDQLKLAQELMLKKKYQEAELKAGLILEKLDPNHLEAQLLLTELKKLIALEKERVNQVTQLSEEAVARLKHLMGLAGIATDEKRFEEAKTLYRQILAIDPNQSIAKENLQAVEAKIVAAGLSAAKLSEIQSELAEHYAQGMMAYNAGNFSQAAFHLRPLLSHPGFRYIKEARNTMNEVNERLKVETEEKMTEATSQMNAGRLTEARQVLEDLLLGTPNHRSALKLKNDLMRELRESARDLYREGYTFEHLVQDYTAAKDRYQKVLDLLPDRDEEYHQKAESRLKQLN